MKTVLLVEDQQELRQATSELLQAQGWRVLVASDGVEALAVVRRRRDELAALVTDIDMPEMNGWALLHRLAAEGMDLPTVVTSSRQPAKSRRLASRGIRFLRKPYDAAELWRQLEAVMAAAPASESQAPEESAAANVGRVPWAAAVLRRPALRRLLTVVAALVLAVGGGLVWRLTAPPELPPPRAERQVRGSGHVELLAPLGDLPRAPEALSWSPVEAAQRYHAEVLGVDGTVLWQGSSMASRVRLPSEIREQLRPAVRYEWQVRAYDADGMPLAASGRGSFRLVPDPTHSKESSP